MKRLRKKLHSESGASLLLAMLLLLVCMMVAASILGAAASNAGKYRSNRIEQQKYLTLTSAIQLIADEIQKAEYKGNYTIYEWTDAAGDDYYHIKQTPGAYSCDQLTAQLPLLKELDEIFSKQFTGTGYTATTDVEASSNEHNLTVTLPGGLTGYPYETSPGPDAYKISGTVNVQVKLDHNTRHIRLTAWLGEGVGLAAAEDIMSAELVAKDALSIDLSPTAGSTPKTPQDPSATSHTYETSPMKWELNWIKKGAA